MNGMEELVVREPEDKALEAADKKQLVSVIIDQQRELNRARAMCDTWKERAEKFQRGYEMLANMDWMMTNERLKKEWRDAEKTPPADSALKWVCSFGGTETTAFFNGGTWWTETHEKIHVRVWQHLPHYKASED